MTRSHGLGEAVERSVAVLSALEQARGDRPGGAGAREQVVRAACAAASSLAGVATVSEDGPWRMRVNDLAAGFDRCATSIKEGAKGATPATPRWRAMDEAERLVVDALRDFQDHPTGATPECRAKVARARKDLLTASDAAIEVARWVLGETSQVCLASGGVQRASAAAAAIEQGLALPGAQGLRFESRWTYDTALRAWSRPQLGGPIRHGRIIAVAAGVLAIEERWHTRLVE